MRWLPRRVQPRSLLRRLQPTVMRCLSAALFSQRFEPFFQLPSEFRFRFPSNEAVPSQVEVNLFVTVNAEDDFLAKSVGEASFVVAIRAFPRKLCDDQPAP